MTHIINTKKPIIPKGHNWKIDYHYDAGKVDCSKLVTHLEPEQEKGYIKGEKLFERLKEKSLPSNVLFYLLKHPEIIPEEWKGKYVYFWGTIYRGPSGNRCVLYLYFFGGEWLWHYHWLGDDWNARLLSAGVASSLPSNPEPSLPLTLNINGFTYKRV